MQITVRFSITRDGRLQGKAAIRYESPDASQDERKAYRIAVADSLAQCAPFPVTKGLGNAIAGHPITIRFIDARKQREAQFFGPKYRIVVSVCDKNYIAARNDPLVHGIAARVGAYAGIAASRVMGARP
jgi:hypothetical protein